MSAELKSQLCGIRKKVDALQPLASATHRAEAAQLMLDEARIHDELGDNEQEQRVLMRIIEEFCDDTHPEAALALSTALRNAAENHYRLDELAQAQALNNRLRRYADHPDDRVRRQVARGLLGYCNYLSELGQHAAELQVYDEIVHRFALDPAAGVREYVASALFDKAVTCDQLGDETAEDNSYRALIDQMSCESSEAIRVQVCKAHVNLLFNLQRAGEFDSALLHVTEVLKLTDGSRHAGLLDQSARALFGAARIHDILGRHDREQSALADLIQRMEVQSAGVARVNLAMALNQKGRGLEVDFNDPHGALALYRQVVERFGDLPMRFDGDDQNSWARRQHEMLVLQVCRALYHAADAHCDLRDFEQARVLIEGLQSAYGDCEQSEVAEILSEAEELLARLTKLSGRTNPLKDLFGRAAMPAGSHLH